jgi:talin
VHRSITKVQLSHALSALFHFELTCDLNSGFSQQATREREKDSSDAILI